MPCCCEISLSEITKNDGGGLIGQDRRFYIVSDKINLLPRETVLGIATMWLIDGKDESEIGELSGVPADVVRKLTRAQTHAMLWASVVGDLIATGHDVSLGDQIRSLKEKPEKAPNTQKRTSRGLWY